MTLLSLRWASHGAAACCLVLFAACTQNTGPDPELGIGNGLPPGAHFNLNVIGVDRGHDHEMSPNSRHTLFVKLTGKCDIGLSKGDYQVLDWSCLDGDRAEFQLPDPDGGQTGHLAYSVFVKALTPRGEANVQTCFTDSEGSFCNIGDLVVNLKKGGQFRNVTKQLLQVCADVDDDPLVQDFRLVPLFSDETADYFWRYDNHGLRLAQFRFYPVQTTDQGGDCTGGQGPAS